MNRRLGVVVRSYSALPSRDTSRYQFSNHPPSVRYPPVFPSETSIQCSLSPHLHPSYKPTLCGTVRKQQINAAYGAGMIIMWTVSSAVFLYQTVVSCKSFTQLTLCRTRRIDPAHMFDRELSAGESLPSTDMTAVARPHKSSKPFMRPCGREEDASNRDRSSPGTRARASFRPTPHTTTTTPPCLHAQLPCAVAKRGREHPAALDPIGF